MADFRIDQEYLLQGIRLLLPTPVHEATQPDGRRVLFGGEIGEAVVFVSAHEVNVFACGNGWRANHSPGYLPTVVSLVN